MSYPKECPVFMVVDHPDVGRHVQFDGYWDMDDTVLVPLLPPPPYPAVVTGAGELGFSHETCFALNQLAPLTPAAVDLLAAIKQELGL